MDRPHPDNAASVNSRIEHGDALELLPTIAPGSVSLVVCSPPYNIQKSHEKRLGVDAYIAWLARLVTLSAATLKPDGAMWINLGFTKVGDARIPIAYLLYPELPASLTLNQTVVWNYRAGVACKRWLSPRHEDLLWLVRDPTNYRFALDRIRDPNLLYPNSMRHGRKRTHPLGKNPGSVWQIPKITSGRGRASAERLPHPAQMPQALAERIVLACSEPGDLVLDPCAGTGTTLAAAVSHGRNAIGIELRPEFCEIATRRLATYFRLPWGPATF